MKKLLLLISIACLFNPISFGQLYVTEVFCSTDTITVHPFPSGNYKTLSQQSDDQEPYQVVQCYTRSNLGIRLDIAISNYYYGKKTTSWLGQHGGPNFNFIATYNKFNLGFRFKPWTIEPKKELIFNGNTLPFEAKLNNIRLDYYLGYSMDFDKLISIEPYVGYNRTSFLVINEDILGQSFSFKKTGGPIIGATLNKYFKFKDYEYLSIFTTFGYGFVNYEKVHPDLDNGYFEWNIGIAAKEFGFIRFRQRVF